MLGFYFGSGLYARITEELRVYPDDSPEGVCYCRVEGTSMLPTLEDNQIVRVNTEFPYESLNVRDIVLIRKKSGFQVIHRIVDRYHIRFRETKGGDNDYIDNERLRPDNYVARLKS